jgi:Amylo-alpha-1,6-glucosidase
VTQGLRVASGRAVCGSLQEAAPREWLVADGLGGYACGTVAGCAPAVTTASWSPRPRRRAPPGWCGWPDWTPSWSSATGGSGLPPTSGSAVRSTRRGSSTSPTSTGQSLEVSATTELGGAAAGVAALLAVARARAQDLAGRSRGRRDERTRAVLSWPGLRPRFPRACWPTPPTSGRPSTTPSTRPCGSCMRWAAMSPAPTKSTWPTRSSRSSQPIAPHPVRHRRRPRHGLAPWGCERDRAYHQGTAWPWLIGPSTDAVRRAGGNTTGLLDGLQLHLSEFGSGSVAETLDGDAPHGATGCPFQAWSVAELVRSRWMEDRQADFSSAPCTARA